MNPRLFSPRVSADLDAIGAGTATSSAVVDAAALTVLAGTIGQRVFVCGANGEPTPLSLFTAVLVPPVAESSSLALQLTAPLEAAQQEIIDSFGTTPEEAARLRLEYAEQEMEAINSIDPQPQKVTALKQRLREAELVVGSRILFHDPGLQGITAYLERAHHQALLTCFSSDHLLHELSSHRGVLAQFLHMGTEARLTLKTAPTVGYSITTLAVMHRHTLVVLPSLRTGLNEVMPFLAIDGPAQFGPQTFVERPVLEEWPALLRRFLHERVHGETRLLTLPADTYVHVNAMLNEVVEPLAAANPGIASFLAPATTVLLRTAALVTLAEDVGATVVSGSALAAATGFCRHWVQVHGDLLSALYPRPPKPRRPLIVRPPDLAVDRRHLIDHLQRRTCDRWRNSRMNLPKRGSGLWEHLLVELKTNAIVRIHPKHVVELNPPPPGNEAEEFYAMLSVYPGETEARNLWVPSIQQRPRGPSASNRPDATDVLTGAVDDKLAQ